MSTAATASAVPAAPELPPCSDNQDIVSGICFRQQAAALQPWAVELRRKLHRHPELSYEEHQTSALVQGTLRDLGIKFSSGWGKDRRLTLIGEGLLEDSTERGDAEMLQQMRNRQHQQLLSGVVEGTGIVADIGTGEQPCVLLRADMDALPILEMTNIPFKSDVPGKMHACGHDAHTTMLLMAAAILKKNEASIEGTVRLVFQPAEEMGKGALMMRNEGLLEIEPKPLRAMALHVSPDLPTGQLASRAGPLMAGTASFHLEILGSGGHAAMPAQTRDPVAACAAVVQNVYSMVARENTYTTFGAGFVSITQIQAGTAYNVIPSECSLMGTIRAFTSARLHELQLRLRQVAQRTAESFRCRLRVRELHMDTPAVSNDTASLATFEKAALAVGAGRIRMMEPIFGGEDFAYFLEKVPGVFGFIGIGSGVGISGHVPTSNGLHSPDFAVDENALAVGAAVEAQYAFYAIDELRRQQQDAQAQKPADEL